MPAGYPVAAPRLPRPVVVGQCWGDVTFVHWPVRPDSVAHLYPPRTRPDVFADGMTYVALVALAIRGSGVGTTPAIPYFGAFLETNIRLYSTEGPEPAFGTALADLRRLLTPDGVLVVMVHNELGVHRLTAEVQPEADQSEPAWSRPADADDTRPRGLADLAEQFGPGAAIWPVYPLPSAPVLAWGPAAGSVDRTEHAGLLAARSGAGREGLFEKTAVAALP